jgi:hypothetical protein
VNSQYTRPSPDEQVGPFTKKGASATPQPPETDTLRFTTTTSLGPS